MWVFEAAEVRHRDPHILVHLVRVAWRNTCFCSESELRNGVGVHLLGVGRVVAQRDQVSWVYRLFLLFGSLFGVLGWWGGWLFGLERRLLNFGWDLVHVWFWASVLLLGCYELLVLLLAYLVVWIGSSTTRYRGCIIIRLLDASWWWPILRCRLWLAPLMRLWDLLSFRIIDHPMICLHRSIDPNQLSLQADVHYVHVNIHSLVIWWNRIIAALRSAQEIVILWIHLKLSVVHSSVLLLGVANLFELTGATTVFGVCQLLGLG